LQPIEAVDFNRDAFAEKNISVTTNLSSEQNAANFI
jgi:hypothetical protein